MALMRVGNQKTGVRVRVVFEPEVAFGPGKADLLEAIAETGSIAAAGRQMGMSYKRAWTLVEEMNAAFTAPVVASVRGGAKGGGAQLTQTGTQVLALFRQLETRASGAVESEIDAMRGLLRDIPGRK